MDKYILKHVQEMLLVMEIYYNLLIHVMKIHIISNLVLLIIFKVVLNVNVLLNVILQNQLLFIKL